MKPLQPQEYIISVVEEFEIEFPGFVGSMIGAKDMIVRRLLKEYRSPADEPIIREAAGVLAKTWEGKRPPGLRNLLNAIEAARSSRKGSERMEPVRARVAAHVDAFTETFLAMNAKQSGDRCELCAADFVGRGVEVDDPLLWHTHFHLAEICADAALEIAIANAARAMGHPLEKKCRAMTAAELDARNERFHDLARLIAPRFAPAGSQ